MNWYVVYTKPKWEKKAAEQLRRIGLNSYCPTIKKTQQWSDRKKKIEAPLFNHYIFVQLEEKEKNLVFISPGVLRYLFWLGKHAIVKDKEIETIKEWLKSYYSEEVSTIQYQVGQKIKLNSGPFCDKNALIKEITKTYYVLILESLGVILKVKNP